MMMEGTQAVKVGLLIKKELLWVNLIGAGIEGNVTPVVLMGGGSRAGHLARGSMPVIPSH